MYGKFGAPALGAVGCGVATAISIWLMFFAMLSHVRMHRAYRPFNFFARIDPPNWPVIGELTRIGAPIAGSILAEGGLFVAAALMMGGMGAIIVGGSSDRAELRGVHVHGAARDQFGDDHPCGSHARARRSARRTQRRLHRRRRCARE